MNRFRRWLFSGFAAFSLLICVAAISLWIRSYRADDGIVRIQDLPLIPDIGDPSYFDRYTTLAVTNGVLTFLRSDDLRPSVDTPGWKRLDYNLGPKLVW